MSDDFLIRLRKPPRREFADTLYERISNETRTSFLSVPIGSMVRRIAWASTTICLVFIAVLVAYPEARAQTGEVVRKIGEMIFTDTLHVPSGGKTAIPAWTTRQQSMSLAQARQALSDPLALSTWTPEGYVFYDQVTVTWMTPPKECTNCQPSWFVSMIWRKPISQPSDYGRDRIALRIFQPAGVYRPTNMKSLEELTINGRPTALLGIRGTAPADPRNPNLSKGLMWTESNHAYELTGWPGVPVEDLIHIAETTP